MTQADREKWDAKYAERPAQPDARPDDWLVACTQSLPPGRALDVACGLGHNAIWLAEQGWQVDAVDISEAGLALADQAATGRGVDVTWIATDLDIWEPGPEAYDLICVFRFLDRDRLPPLLVRGLRPGGSLVYETFSTAQCARHDNHLSSSRFALQPGELPRLYADLTVRAFDDCELADRSVARFWGQKPETEATAPPAG